MAPHKHLSTLPSDRGTISESIQVLVPEITSGCCDQQCDRSSTPVSPADGDFSCQNLTLLQQRLLTRMKRVGHTTIAGFTNCFEDYGTEETEAALRDLQTKGLVIERTWRKWQLTGEGLQYARGLRHEQLQHQG